MTDVPDESEDGSIAVSTRVPADDSVEESQSDGDAEPTPTLTTTRAQ